MTERFMSKFSQRDVTKIAHEAGRRGLDGLSFVYVTPRSSATASIVSYVIVYVMAGWGLGGHVRKAR
jgi:hypothetical protein